MKVFRSGSLVYGDSVMSGAAKIVCKVYPRRDYLAYKFVFAIGKGRHEFVGKVAEAHKDDLQKPGKKAIEADYPEHLVEALMELRGPGTTRDQVLDDLPQMMDDVLKENGLADQYYFRYSV